MTGSQESRGALMPGVLMPGVHRTIRALDPDEGPFGGTLVTGLGAVVVSVDAVAISGWRGWEHAGHEHVAGPLDLVRREDGHDVLLPWCIERLSVFLGRRLADGQELGAGEISTLVGSMLRGLDELGSDDGGAAVDGDWWLTEDGRPMFVIGTGGAPRETSALLLDRLQRDCRDRAMSRFLATVRDGLRAEEGRPGVPRRRLELWEAELFALAAPRPLNRETHAPARARDIEMVRALRATATETRRTRRRVAEPAPGDVEVGPLRGVRVAVSRRMQVVGRLIGMRWHALRGDVRRTDLDGRDRHGSEGAKADAEGTAGTPARRSRRLVVAGVAAAVVLGAGLLWPGGATGEADNGGGEAGQVDGGTTTSPEEGGSTTGRSAGESRTDGASEAGPETPLPAPTADDAPNDRAVADEAPSAGDDPVAAAESLLARIRDCASVGDTVCRDAVADGSPGIVDRLSVGGTAGTVLTLIDEYGDVAVVRATAPPVDEAELGVERMLVLIRVTDEWLVRDAYDVADQPG